MSTPKVEPKKYDRECVFVGRRLDGQGKTVWAFELLPTRETMLFGRIQGVYIGYTYECKATQISKKPAVTERKRENNPEWEGLDALVDAKNAEQLAQRKLAASSKPAMKHAIEAIRPLVKRMNFSQRRALLEYLIMEGIK